MLNSLINCVSIIILCTVKVNALRMGKRVFNYYKSVCKFKVRIVEQLKNVDSSVYFCSVINTFNTFAVSWIQTMFVENQNMNFKLGTTCF